jgi:hypothetical protein
MIFVVSLMVFDPQGYSVLWCCFGLKFFASFLAKKGETQLFARTVSV